MEEVHADSKIATRQDDKIILEQHKLPSRLSSTERWKTEDYDLQSCKYPGKFIIFNHYSYDTKLPLSTRKGTKEDANRVKETFEKMGFHEADECQEDLTCEQLTKKINEVTLKPFHDYGSVVIVILTHGELGKLYAQDTDYEVTLLWNVLTQDENARNLAGKPKLFLIQACQGDVADSGLTYTDAKPEQKIFRIPLFADFLIAFSSSPGYLSFRQESGSWFIQCLCDAIDQFKDITDFESLLTLVKYDVAHNKESYSPREPGHDNKKQIPVVSSTLTKKLYMSEAAANLKKMPIHITLQQPNMKQFKTQNYESEESDANTRPAKKDQSRKRSTAKNVQDSNLMRNPPSPKHPDKVTSADPRITGNFSCSNDNLSGYAAITMITFLVTSFIFWMLRSDYHIHCYPPQ